MKLEGQVGGDRDKRKWRIKGLWASEPLGLMLLHTVTDSRVILHSIPCIQWQPWTPPPPLQNCIQSQFWPFWKGFILRFPFFFLCCFCNGPRGNATVEQQFMKSDFLWSIVSSFGSILNTLTRARLADVLFGLVPHCTVEPANLKTGDRLDCMDQDQGNPACVPSLG